MLSGKEIFMRITEIHFPQEDQFALAGPSSIDILVSCRNEMSLVNNVDISIHDALRILKASKIVTASAEIQANQDTRADSGNGKSSKEPDLIDRDYVNDMLPTTFLDAIIAAITEGKFSAVLVLEGRFIEVLHQGGPILMEMNDGGALVIIPEELTKKP